jgi:hypothetical protein
MLSLVEKLHLFEGLLAKYRYTTDEINMGFLSEERNGVLQHIIKLPVYYPGYKFIVSYALNIVIAKYRPHDTQSHPVQIVHEDPLKAHFEEGPDFV